MAQISATPCGARAPAVIDRGAPTGMPRNLEYRVGLLRRFGLPGGGAWLDCGCGDGMYTLALLEAGADHVVGVDIEFERIEQARARARLELQAEFSVAESEILPFADSSFDGVLLNEVLEHVADEMATLGEIARVLKPGGTLALFSPNRWFPLEGHGMRVGRRTIDVPTPLLPWLPGRIASRFMRARNYWPRELRDLVASAGLQVLVVRSVLPVFEAYPWLPASLIRWYDRYRTRIERAPIVGRFGVSTLVLARKAGRDGRAARPVPMTPESPGALPQRVSKRPISGAAPR